MTKVCKTLDEAVTWLKEQVAAYVKQGGTKYDYAINYHASHIDNEPTPINVVFIKR